MKNKKSGKKILNLDGKKRVTLGKLISKETTFFEVEKRADGTIILSPKSNLNEEEIWVYKNKSAYKSLKNGIIAIKKGLVTKIDESFWEDFDISDLKYTNEFLKNLKPIILKNDLKLFKEIKIILKNICENKAEKIVLQNVKTHSNNDVFSTSLTGKNNSYKIFWTIKNSQTIILSLIKKT